MSCTIGDIPTGALYSYADPLHLGAYIHIPQVCKNKALARDWSNLEQSVKLYRPMNALQRELLSRKVSGTYTHTYTHIYIYIYIHTHTL
jgi:hypothetical protein